MSVDIGGDMGKQIGIARTYKVFDELTIKADNQNKYTYVCCYDDFGGYRQERP